MTTKVYFDFSGGINYSQTKPALGASKDKVYFEDTTNIKLYKDSGITRVKGNKTILDTKLGTDIQGIYAFKSFNQWVCVFVSDGVLYNLNVSDGTYTEVVDVLSDSEKCTFVPYNSGLIISDGVTEPFIYYPSRSTTTSGTVTINGTVNVVGSGTLFTEELAVGDSITINSETRTIATITDNTHLTVRTAFTTSTSGVLLALNSISFLNCNSIPTTLGNISPRSKAIWVWFDRIFIGTEDGGLFWTALNEFNDWTTADDAGYSFEIGKPIYCLRDYKGLLVLFHGVNNGTSIVQGSTDPTQWQFQFNFCDKSTSSPWASATIENNQFFVDDGIYSLAQVGELNQVRLSSEFSGTLRTQNGLLNGLLDTGRLNEVIVQPYTKERCVWFYLPITGETEFNTAYIYYYNTKSWFKKVVPQNITCATQFDTFLLVGTDDGDILIEEYGENFNGEPISFSCESQYFNFGDISRNKKIREFYITAENTVVNNFDFSVKLNYDDSVTFDTYTITDDDTLSGVWDDDDSLWDDVVVWALTSNSTMLEQLYGYNKAIKLIFSGTNNQNICIIGLEFRDITVVS